VCGPCVGLGAGGACVSLSDRCVSDACRPGWFVCHSSV